MTKAKNGNPKPDPDKVREIKAAFEAAYPHMDFSFMDGGQTGGWESPIDMDRFGRLMEEWVKDPELRELSLPVVKYALQSALSTNSSNAAKHPRPRKAPVWKTATIKAMKKERKRGGNFDDFLMEAEEGNFYQLQIEQTGHEIYAIEWDEMEKSPPIKLATLKSWWTDAGK